MPQSPTDGWPIRSSPRVERQITVDDFILVLDKLVEADNGRTAVEVRSYGAPAYQLAISARTNPETPLPLGSP